VCLDGLERQHKGIDRRSLACVVPRSPVCSGQSLHPGAAHPWMGSEVRPRATELPLRRDFFPVLDGSLAWKHWHQGLSPVAEAAKKALYRIPDLRIPPPMPAMPAKRNLIL
jgi:hypothetical protein